MSTRGRSTRLTRATATWLSPRRDSRPNTSSWFQVHIYNRGVEIATNLAADSVELTREEAFEYVRMEYVSAHKGDTLLPRPRWGGCPRIATAGDRQVQGTFFVQVSKDGIGHDAFDDRFCTRRIDDPFLVAVVRGLRFKPALSSGVPVDSVAAVNLSQLLCHVSEWVL